jgi:peptide chain release factor 2
VVLVGWAGAGEDVATDAAGLAASNWWRRPKPSACSAASTIARTPSSRSPGRGRRESQDWADMLLRMYLKWTERRGFKRDILDYQPGDEAGLKSATLTVTGDYAYGMLLAEAGVHRLVRISPFDQAARRHTSFASVYVWPELEDDVEIEVDEKDLRVDTFCASGPGGQGVNTTYSAVAHPRHLPATSSCRARTSGRSTRTARQP